jgi:hypothetical protein
VSQERRSNNAKSLRDCQNCRIESHLLIPNSNTHRPAAFEEHIVEMYWSIMHKGENSSVVNEHNPGCERGWELAYSDENAKNTLTSIRKGSKASANTSNRKLLKSFLTN